MTILNGNKEVLDNFKGSNLDYHGVSEIMRLYGHCEDWNGTDDVVGSYLYWLTVPDTDHPEHYDDRYGRIKNGGGNYLYFRK